MRSNKKINLMFGWLFALALMSSGCVSATNPGADNPDAINTQAAATIMMQLTLQAGETAAAQLTQIASQPTATLTSLPSSTPEPTATSAPTATFTSVPPTPTTPAQLCNAAEFVKDITIPDGEELKPEQAFTKTWRLKNAGSCAWGAGYTLVFFNGDRMSASPELVLGATVNPGQLADISVVLRAPKEPGAYAGYWMLRGPDGVLFGIGSDAQSSFWVKIVVTSDNREVIYDMAENYCAATWSTNAGVRPCPSSDINTANGFITRVDAPQLENGTRDDEPALFVLPDSSPNGFITGRYPAFPVKSGDRFRAVIGCGANNLRCDVQFELFYSADGGAFQSLGSWRERNEGKFVKLDIDLSFLDDSSVVFVLSVTNNGDSDDDVAHWLAPRIVR